MSYTKTSLIEAPDITISHHLSDLGIDNVRNEILHGLLAENKYISSKFFYNEKGSKLFELITKLPEYYPTRTEKSIIKSIAPEIMSTVKNLDIIEFGSGDCSKIKIFLASIEEDNIETVRYIPVDVSSTAIEKSANELVEQFPGLEINGFVADFINQIDVLPSNRKRLFLFLGSTLGNFTNDVALKFLCNLSDQMNSGDQFLLGLDLVKPIDILNSAYNDKQEVTADFNKNILNVINKIIDANFSENDFEHLAFFNHEKSRIEMHLKANKNISVTTPYSDKKITFNIGETIHTENSYKFTEDQIFNLGANSNLKLKQAYKDHKNWFALNLFEK